MKILVTGGAGFIGSHLVDALVTDGHEVIVFDNLRRGRSEYIEPRITKKQIVFIEGDIRNLNQVQKACQDCEIVFHLAAQSNVIGAATDLDYSFETNVIGTYNVLKSAREQGVRRFIFTSSREVYGEALYLPVDEAHPLQAKNAYGASKIAGETYCEVFRNMEGMEIFIFRLANVYGSRDTNRVIPIFLDRLNAEQPLVIYGGKQVIDFISVEFIVRILKNTLNEELSCPHPVNIGSGKGTNLFELAARLESLLHRKAPITIEPARDVEVKAFVADISRMQKIWSLELPSDPLYFLKEMI